MLFAKIGNYSATVGQQKKEYDSAIEGWGEYFL